MASAAPTNFTATNIGAEAGSMPAKVSDRVRAAVTAGLANAQHPLASGWMGLADRGLGALAGAAVGVALLAACSGGPTNGEEGADRPGRGGSRFRPPRAQPTWWRRSRPEADPRRIPATAATPTATAAARLGPANWDR